MLMNQHMKYRYELVTKGWNQVKEIIKEDNKTLIIHYSCESFYDTDGFSPRVTSIAVRFLATGLTRSFSINSYAERECINKDNILSNYGMLEKKLLDEFYDFVKRYSEYKWIHWNMRDTNYGFFAIDNRYRVLGGEPTEIHVTYLIDLAKLVGDLFGPEYCKHPRLENLIKINGITSKEFLNGADEAEAFQNMELNKLHQSSLRKVDVLSNVVYRLADGSLKTNNRMKKMYGSLFVFFVVWIRESWTASVLLFILAMLPLIKLASLGWAFVTD